MVIQVCQVAVCWIRRGTSSAFRSAGCRATIASRSSCRCAPKCSGRCRASRPPETGSWIPSRSRARQGPRYVLLFTAGLTRPALLFTFKFRLSTSLDLCPSVQPALFLLSEPPVGRRVVAPPRQRFRQAVHGRDRVGL